jgi:hypothetical protein
MRRRSLKCTSRFAGGRMSSVSRPRVSLKRLAFKIFVGLCAILCISVLWLWSRSRHYCDICEYSHNHTVDPGYSVSGVTSFRGVFQAGLWISSVRRAAPAPGLQFESFFDGQVSLPYVSALYPKIYYRNNLKTAGFLMSGVSIPYWLLATLLVMPPTIWIRSQINDVRARRRIRSGRCAKCDYDLRLNTSGRCPECGSAVQPVVQAANT